MRLQALPTNNADQQLFAAYCYSTDAVGDVVYIMGNKVGDRYQVTKVDIDDILTVPAVGIITRKTAPTDCEVQIGGILRGLYSGLTPQKVLFIGLDSRLTHITTPHPGSGRRALQIMGQALSTSELFLSAQSPIILVS
jgi:hypothetical protein